ncbi:MAG: DNA gyrase C-terminal beta-propeller domain-containing protein, partial [Oceanococcaceae bacterium]
DGERNLMLFTRMGRVCRFDESAVRAMGRTAFGVRGIRLSDEDEVISMIVDRGEQVLTVSEKGFGKRSGIEEYPVKGRGTQGVLSMKLSERTGNVVAAIPVKEGDDIMLIAATGQLVRTSVNEVSVLSRNTQGVKLINLRDTYLVGVDRIDAELVAEAAAAAEASEDGDPEVAPQD